MAFQLGNLPTTGQKQALAGTNGAPATGNEYITKQAEAAASGVATLDVSSHVVQRLSYETVPGGVATLNGSSQVVQHSAFEGQPNGVATLNGASGLTLAQLLRPISGVQTLAFTATTSSSIWLCNTDTVASFTASLPNANTLPNGFVFSFINVAPTAGSTLTIGSTGGNTLVGSTSIVGGASGSLTFYGDGASVWYQIT